MSLESRRLKNFFVKIIVFTGVVPLCFSFLFLYYIIRSNQHQLAVYNLYEVRRSELEIKTFLMRTLDSLHKVIASDELKQFLKSSIHNEQSVTKNLQALFHKERVLLNQGVFYCIYGSQGRLLYGEKTCPSAYDKQKNARVVFTKRVIFLNMSHIFESDVKNRFFFSVIIPFDVIKGSQPLLASITPISDDISHIQFKAHLKSEEFAQKINFLFYFGVLMCSLISVGSIIYGIKIAHALKKKAEDSLQLATIGKLAHMLAHDIKKPFLNFVNFMQDVVLCKTQKEREELVHTTQQSLQTSQVFIENLLNDLMKSHDNALYIIQNLSLSDIIRSCFEMFVGIDDKKISISLEFKHTLQINADPVKLKRAFLNIISNAIEVVNVSNACGSEEKIIKIESYDEQSSVRIVFYNSDKSIESEQLENIFEPFYTTKTNGNGLGLFITKRIIEMHGGKISCYAKKSDGVYFNVDLPGVKPSEVPITNDKNHDFESAECNRFVFLIDDCPLMLRRWKRVLEQKYPYLTIQEFLNFEDFFDFIVQKNITNTHIETIISDYMFGESDTIVFDALKKIRKFYSKKIYIATNMDSLYVSQQLLRFDINVIDKNLTDL